MNWQSSTQALVSSKCSPVFMTKKRMCVCTFKSVTEDVIDRPYGFRFYFTLIYSYGEGIISILVMFFSSPNAQWLESNHLIENWFAKNFYLMFISLPHSPSSHEASNNKNCALMYAHIQPYTHNYVSKVLTSFDIFFFKEEVCLV